jgi:hypothetical protein
MMAVWKPLLPTVISPNVRKQSIYFTRVQGTEIDILALQNAVFDVLSDPDLKQSVDIPNPKPTSKTRLDLGVRSRRYKEDKRIWPSLALHFR